ncbi:HGGxSTG domain-containing protein [Streptomyces sp. NPDC056362]|uniref:HGGxSTG domain-containing protein n=1 Tax=unclassified Streptomyces TaxID=2593676 RepID=UPI0035E183BA
MTQSKCGARTQSGRSCQNKAIIGSSRCAKHQGPWSAYGVAQRTKKEAEAKTRALRKRK